MEAALIFVGVLYFLPALIAILRQHQSWPAIAALNVLLGWTAIGWIIAFVWSLSAVRRDTVVVVRDRYYRPW